METSGFRKCAVVEAEPWGGLGEERGSLPPQNLMELGVRGGESR